MKRQLFFWLVIFFLMSLACGGRVFEKQRVYSVTRGPAKQFYDSTTNKILADDVWVFQPDGTFAAIVMVNGERRILSGKYEGDETGGGFFFFLDLDGDGNFNDDNIFLGKDDSYIEWRRNSETFTYFLAQ